MAYQHYPSAWKAKESAGIVFSKNELPTAGSSYALCKVSMHILNAWQYLYIYYRYFLKVLIIIIDA